MKIAAYHNLPTGGAKRALFNYTRGLIEQGHEVDIYAPPSANEEFLDLRALASAYFEMPLWSPAPFLARSLVTRELARYAVCRWGLVGHARVVAEAIDAGGYDVAFVHHCQFAQTPYVLNFLTTPSVYYCQEPRRASFEYSIVHEAPESPDRLKRLLQRAHRGMFELELRRRDVEAARSATLILANSFFSVESIRRAYGRYARVAYLGIERDTFHAAEGQRARAVVSVGALHPSKGHRLVIEAVGALTQTGRPAVRIVADRGEEAHASELHDLAAQLGVSVSIHRQATEAELVELYATSSVAVCAAELEPFGFTPLEAMACGTPVVAVREGGYRETVIDRHNGLLRARDVDQIAAAIGELLDDRATWEKLSAGALETAPLWSTDRATSRLEALLAGVCRTS